MEENIDTKQFDFGMIGLGVMGSNLLLNMADHGFKVIGFDLNREKTIQFEKAAREGTIVKGVNTLAEMVSNLKKPAKLMMLVPAGKPVDDVIRDLLPLVEKGDIIIDGGNSHYIDTQRRILSLQDKGLHFMGIGISGGEQGARLGPSIMPGGDMDAYEEIAPLLMSVAAKVDDKSCVAYLGKGAAGHYVKMVHNGIEYAIMQLISECYDLMHNGLGISNAELSEIFSKWNTGEMQSFLMEITAIVFSKKDEASDDYLIDRILDRAGAKGTGKWTSEEGLDLPIPIPTIDIAVMMRNLSSLKTERIEASNVYGTTLNKIDTDKETFLTLLHDALYLSSILSYAQGLAMLTTASKELQMNIPMNEVVQVWKGGCIIRSEALNIFAEVFKTNPGLQNLLLDLKIASIVKAKLPALQTVVQEAAKANYPAAGMMASLNYLNAYTRNLLPTNLIQAQRDLFGAHTYQRTDKEGFFHTNWETLAKP